MEERWWPGAKRSLNSRSPEILARLRRCASSSSMASLSVVLHPDDRSPRVPPARADIGLLLAGRAAAL
eukprot:scaffold52245_cov32-Tisochrysis_lutea.AAC.4